MRSGCDELKKYHGDRSRSAWRNMCERLRSRLPHESAPKHHKVEIKFRVSAQKLTSCI